MNTPAALLLFVFWRLVGKDMGGQGSSDFGRLRYVKSSVYEGGVGSAIRMAKDVYGTIIPRTCVTRWSRTIARGDVTTRESIR